MSTVSSPAAPEQEPRTLPAPRISRLIGKVCWSFLWRTVLVAALVNAAWAWLVGRTAYLHLCPAAWVKPLTWIGVAVWDVVIGLAMFDEALRKTYRRLHIPITEKGTPDVEGNAPKSHQVST